MYFISTGYLTNKSKEVHIIIIKMQTIQETQLFEPIDSQFLVDAKTKTTIPLKSTRFDVDIT